MFKVVEDAYMGEYGLYNRKESQLKFGVFQFRVRGYRSKKL